MFITKSNLWATLHIAIFACVGAATAEERNKAADAKDQTTVKGTLASVDAEKNTVTVRTHKFDRATGVGTDTDKAYPLAKDAVILQDDAVAKLGDLKKGNPVAVKLDGENAASVSVDGGTSQGEFHSANIERNTITVIAGRNKDKKVYHLLKTTKVTGADGKPVLVKDLKAGTKLLLTRSVEDDNTAIRVQAQAEADKQ